VGSKLHAFSHKKLAATNAGPQQQADQQVALVAQQVQFDDAAIDNAKAYLDYTVIASPIDGRTVLRQVDPGNIIHAADVDGVVLITQILPITMVFTLPQRDLFVVSAALARGGAPVEILQDDGSHVLARGTLQTPEESDGCRQLLAHAAGGPKWPCAAARRGGEQSWLHVPRAHWTL
jgi:multidrug efflux pump subunit AcrA (membrane-fusion protein)